MPGSLSQNPFQEILSSSTIAYKGIFDRHTHTYTCCLLFWSHCYRSVLSLLVAINSYQQTFLSSNTLFQLSPRAVIWLLVRNHKKNPTKFSKYLERLTRAIKMLVSDVTGNLSHPLGAKFNFYLWRTKSWLGWKVNSSFQLAPSILDYSSHRENWKNARSRAQCWTMAGENHIHPFREPSQSISA